MNIKEILEKKDKEVILNFLVEKEFKSEDNGILDFDVYQSSFKERNTYSLEDIKKFFIDNKITEINQETVNKTFDLINVSKALTVENATQGIIIALKSVLDDLYYDSKFFLNQCTDKFTNADIIRQINLFLFYIKTIKDDLGFITFNNGKIETVPITEKISKYWDDEYYDNPSEVNEWEIREINRIDAGLKVSINLLSALLSIYPGDEKFKFFYTILETGLMTISDMDAIFKDVVILANSLDIIRVTPKTIKETVKPVVFYENVNKSLEYIVKNVDSQGIITGIVLEPGTPDQRDLQEQYISAEEIEKAMIGYMENHQQLGLQHETILKSDKTDDREATLLENYITQQDITIGSELVKKGSWIQTWKTYGSTKELIDKGLKTGFSIGGTANVIKN
jgi:hypothetical protein